MRGEVLHYDDNTGIGLISGDDGIRYEFRRADLHQLRPVVRGMRVDFIGNVTAATQIYVLEGQAGAAAGVPLESSNEDLNLWEYFTKCMSKSFDGEGRARRKEYWSFVLFELLAFLLAFVIFAVVSGPTSYNSDYSYNPASGIGVAVIILMVLVFIPAGITVTVRRLHDIGLTGWLIFISLIPYLGSFVLLIMSLIPSERRVNKHGLYPKPLH